MSLFHASPSINRIGRTIIIVLGCRSMSKPWISKPASSKLTLSRRIKFSSAEDFLLLELVSGMTISPVTRDLSWRRSCTSGFGALLFCLVVLEQVGEINRTQILPESIEDGLEKNDQGIFRLIRRFCQSDSSSWPALSAFRFFILRRCFTSAVMISKELRTSSYSASAGKNKAAVALGMIFMWRPKASRIGLGTYNTPEVVSLVVCSTIIFHCHIGSKLRYIYYIA